MGSVQRIRPDDQELYPDGYCRQAGMAIGMFSIPHIPRRIPHANYAPRTSPPHTTTSPASPRATSARPSFAQPKDSPAKRRCALTPARDGNRLGTYNTRPLFLLHCYPDFSTAQFRKYMAVFIISGVIWFVHEFMYLRLDMILGTLGPDSGTKLSCIYYSCTFVSPD